MSGGERWKRRAWDAPAPTTDCTVGPGGPSHDPTAPKTARVGLPVTACALHGGQAALRMPERLRLFEPVDFLDALGVAPALELRLQERADDLRGDVLGRQTGTQRDDVGVVVRA